MADFLKKLTDAWKNINRMQRIMIIAVLAMAVVVIVVVVTTYSKEEYSVLYSNLSQAEAAEIYTALQEEEVDVRATGDGTTILVPKGSAEDIKLTLSAKGIPSGGVMGYDFYIENAGSFGATDKDKERIYTYQLQQNLVQSINAMAKVKNSVVLLSLADDSTFVVSNADNQISTAAIQIEPELGPILQKRMPIP